MIFLQSITHFELSKTLQRYENKSKSQRSGNPFLCRGGCLRLCKDTKIKANHNRYPNLHVKWLLSKTLQRYENKSKSQLDQMKSHFNVSCLRLCKDTKIKANHNAPLVGLTVNKLSKTLQRYENKSKSQLDWLTSAQQSVV